MVVLVNVYLLTFNVDSQNPPTSLEICHHEGRSKSSGNEGRKHSHARKLFNF